MKNFITLLLAVHFSVLIIHITVKNINNYEWIEEKTSKYVNPFFMQEWEMFAPPPIDNTRLYFRYEVVNKSQRDTTGFSNVLEPLYKAQTTNNSPISRVSYYLFNSTVSILKNYDYYLKNATECEKENSDELNAYIDKQLMKSYSHQSLMHYGKKVFLKQYPELEFDSVSMSYHILQVGIPSFEKRFEEKVNDMESAELEAWNSSFYKIF